MPKENQCPDLYDSDLVTIIYEVDPSTSYIEDENVSLAAHMLNRFVSIEIFDADTRFHFASCKMPLFEFLRQ